YWLLHARQARYYSLSSLCLVLTLVAYTRWQQGARLGAVAFVVVAWCWFQVDYGTVWPGYGVLFVDAFVAALRADWRSAWKPAATGAALAAGIAPFVVFYRLAHRQSGLLGTWLHRWQGALFNLNEYVVPLIVVLAAVVLVVVHRRQLPPLESRLVAVPWAVLAAPFAWGPTVAPRPSLRFL